MADFRPGRGSPIPNFSMTDTHSEAYMMDQRRERQYTDLVPPPRNAKRVERASEPSSLTPQQARHLQDLQLDEVCRTEAREGKKSLESRRNEQEAKAVDKARDVEKQNEESRDIPEPDPNRYRPFSGSKTPNHFFDWVAMSPSFYVGAVMLAVFLATTLFLVMKPPRTLEVMRVSLWRWFDV